MLIWTIITYIIIGIITTVAYIIKHSDPLVRMHNGAHPEMSKWELVFAFFLWPFIILIAVIGKII